MQYSMCDDRSLRRLCAQETCVDCEDGGGRQISIDWSINQSVTNVYYALSRVTQINNLRLSQLSECKRSRARSSERAGYVDSEVIHSDRNTVTIQVHKTIELIRRSSYLGVFNCLFFILHLQLKGRQMVHTLFSFKSQPVCIRCNP